VWQRFAIPEAPLFPMRWGHQSQSVAAQLHPARLEPDCLLDRTTTVTVGDRRGCGIWARWVWTPVAQRSAAPEEGSLAALEVRGTVPRHHLTEVSSHLLIS